MGRSICLTIAMYRTTVSFEGCRGIGKSPTKKKIKKKKMQTLKKITHKSSLYQPTSTKIQETNPKPCMNCSRTGWGGEANLKVLQNCTQGLVQAHPTEPVWGWAGQGEQGWTHHHTCLHVAAHLVRLCWRQGHWFVFMQCGLEEHGYQAASVGH